MKIRRDLGTHLIYIFISIVPINSITKPDNRVDCKLQTEGFNSTHGHIVRRQDIQHTVSYTANRREDSCSTSVEQFYNS